MRHSTIYPTVGKAIEATNKQFKDEGYIFIVVIFLNRKIRLLTEFEIKMQSSNILEIVYSPEVGYFIKRQPKKILRTKRPPRLKKKKVAKKIEPSEINSELSSNTDNPIKEAKTLLGHTENPELNYSFDDTEAAKKGARSVFDSLDDIIADEEHFTTEVSAPPLEQEMRDSPDNSEPTDISADEVTADTPIDIELNNLSSTKTPTSPKSSDSNPAFNFTLDQHGELVQSPGKLTQTELSNTTDSSNDLPSAPTDEEHDTGSTEAELSNVASVKTPAYSKQPSPSPSSPASSTTAPPTTACSVKVTQQAMIEKKQALIKRKKELINSLKAQAEQTEELQQESHEELVIPQDVEANEPSDTDIHKNNSDEGHSNAEAEKESDNLEHYLRLTDHFSMGMWFEKRESPKTSYRCKLAAILPGKKFILTNTAGLKIHEETRENLARQLESGELKIESGLFGGIDDSSLYDNALRSVISNSSPTSPNYLLTENKKLTDAVA